MNKYGISEAKSRVGFKTYAVQKNASLEGQSHRGWLLKAAVFVSAFSMVFSVFTPTTMVRATDNNAVNDKVQVCHKEGNGSFHSIEVNGNALQAHIDHGDLYPVPQNGCPDIATNKIIIRSSTTAVENDLGKWFFNRDSGTTTPYAFDSAQNSIGEGSLHVLPIGANPSDKMIGEYFINTPITDLTGISYDFQIGAGGDNTKEEHFYMNVYANFGVSDDLKYYDCRYDVVPTIGSTGGFTTVSFDPTQIYPVTTRTGGSASPFPCPAIPADMNLSSAGSNIRMIALSVGDTSASDTGLDGYLDKVVISKTSLITTFDFEPVCEEIVNLDSEENDIRRLPRGCDEDKKRDVKIKKVWEGYGDGQGPSNQTDINITVTTDIDDEVCKYDDEGELKCKVRFTEGSTVNVVETGLPAGWEADPATVGDVTPICEDANDLQFNDNNQPELDKDGKHKIKKSKKCTVTIINKRSTPKPCGQELVINGGFELPEVIATQGWEVFPSGSTGMGWSVDWINNDEDAPDIGNLELHEGVNGWDSKSGNQHTELDSDWGGPTSNQSGEDASVKIYQDLITKIGSTYTVKFWTSPRPNLSAGENKIQFKVGGLIDMTVNEIAGGSDTAWTEHVHTFVATSGVTRLSFEDAGPGNSLGGFLDDVSVEEECLSDVTLCKEDQDGNPLAGWELYLKGDVLDTVEVASEANGANFSSIELPAGNYVLEASGTYVYRPGSSGDISDAGYTLREPNEFGGPAVPHWKDVNTLPNPYEGYLGIQVNELPFNWGPLDTANHEYSAFHTLGSDGEINFRILDSHYGDNDGSLEVDISPIYKGTTGADGCVTLQDVPYDTYDLDEIMQDGWEYVEGKNSIKIDQPVEGPGEKQEDNFTLVNECTSEECERPMLHLIKVVCAEYNDVQGHQDADLIDETEGNYDDFWNYNNGTFNPSPLVNGYVNPSEIPGVDDEDTDCARADGWNFTLSDNGSHSGPNVITAGPTVNGEFVTPISGEGSALTPALQTAIVDGQLWVSEVEKDNYGFAAIRCYNDALNGDNLEYISLGDNEPAHIYCIAYNVELEKPCVEERVPVALISETDTKTAGYTDENPEDNPLDPFKYEDAFSNSALANTVIPPWIDPAGFAPFTGSGAKWISTTSAHPGQAGGEGGDGDQWRLFQKKFTVPSGATVTPGTIYFTADNAVSVYLNGTLIDDTSENLGTFNTPHPQGPYQVFTGVYSTTFTPVAGQENTLEFVVRNSGGDYGENPTALLYKADFVYTTDCDGGNEEGFDISGIVYNDQDQDNTKDAEEPGLPDWTVNLFEFNDGESFVDDELSDSDGNYLFSNLDAGCYIVREVPKENWTQTEPNVINHEYFVSLGNAKCPFVDDVSYSEGLVKGLFVKTAHAADSNIIFAEGDAVGLNFGNYTTDDSSTNGGGSGSRRTPDDDGRVLGDSTGLPYRDPRVLGAATELPRTGTPIALTFTFIGILAIVMVPRMAKLKIQK